MKIYKRIVPTIIRLQIIKQKHKTLYLPLCETTLEEVKKMVQTVITKQSISPFTMSKKTQVCIIELTGTKRGRYDSVCFRGLDPSEVVKLIKEHIKTLNSKHHE
jgi:hypothetical protein